MMAMVILTVTGARHVFHGIDFADILMRFARVRGWRERPLQALAPLKPRR